MTIRREQVYADRYLCGKVKRYHAWPMIQQQTVAEHCWRVACLYVEVFGMPSAEVLYYCLHHDSGELSAGDPPFGVKNRVPGYKEVYATAEKMGFLNIGIRLPSLTEQEFVKVKICDLLEMWETGIHEMRLGNAYAEPIVKDTLSTAHDLAVKHNYLDELTKYMQGGRYGSEQGPGRRVSL